MVRRGGAEGGRETSAAQGLAVSGDGDWRLAWCAVLCCLMGDGSWLLRAGSWLQGLKIPHGCRPMHRHSHSTSKNKNIAARTREQTQTDTDRHAQVGSAGRVPVHDAKFLPA